MALATQADVETDLGRTLTEAEASRVVGLLARADALVRGYLGCADEPDPIPAAVTAVVAGIVSRALAVSVPGVQSVQVDDASVRYSPDAGNGGLWLSKVDRMSLRPYRCGGGLASVKFVGERYDITETTTA